MLLCTLLLTAPLAIADVTTSAITGRVSIGGAPATGVTVTVESPALQHPRTTTTGPRGTYWLGALPPGQYDVTFSLAGHTTMTRRAIVELARVARSDATLEPNADEESVTSTATTPNVTETTAITTHFDDETLDRLPLGRDNSVSVAPDLSFQPYASVDGVPAFLGGVVVAEDLIEQMTVVRGGAPVEVEAFGGKVLAIRTRRGGEDLAVSLRDILSNPAWIDNDFAFDAENPGVQHRIEATAGGRIVPEKLWFFAGAWNGDDATSFLDDVRGFNVKLQAQIGAAHHVDGNYTESRGSSAPLFRSETSSAWLGHTAVAGPRFTWETHLARTSIAQSFLGSPFAPAQHSHFLSSRVSYVTNRPGGDHVLTAGVSAWDPEAFDVRSVYAGDRWSFSRWVVNAGVRYDDIAGAGRFTPRIAATYDLGGRGTSALAASYGEYVVVGAPASRVPLVPPRVFTLGYAAAIGSAGTLRIDALRSDVGSSATDSLQLDTHYRLFDRFEAGATYTYTRVEDSGGLTPVYPEHVANAWIGAELPVGDHEFGVTLLQRYLPLVNPPYSDSVLPTDIALRYAIPFPRFRLTLAADATNVLADGESPLAFPRALRFWVRARL